MHEHRRHGCCSHGYRQALLVSSVNLSLLSPPFLARVTQMAFPTTALFLICKLMRCRKARETSIYHERSNSRSHANRTMPKGQRRQGDNPPFAYRKSRGQLPVMLLWTFSEKLAFLRRMMLYHSFCMTADIEIWNTDNQHQIWFGDEIRCWKRSNFKTRAKNV